MKTKKTPLFECMECGKLFYSVSAAEKASFGSGCPKCGSTDIDLPRTEREKAIHPDSEHYLSEEELESGV
jgi:predicted  nucleic acid-binding Zn-ribbon protein